MTRLADDFAEIRARRDELARDRSQEPQCSDPKGCEHPGLCLNPCRVPPPTQEMAGLDGPDTDWLHDTDLLRAIFGDNADKIAAHAEALGPDDRMYLRGPRFELARQPDGRWRGSVDGNPIGPYDKLPTALDVAFSLRGKCTR